MPFCGAATFTILLGFESPPRQVFSTGSPSAVELLKKEKALRHPISIRAIPKIALVEGEQVRALGFPPKNAAHDEVSRICPSLSGASELAPRAGRRFPAHAEALLAQRDSAIDP